MQTEGRERRKFRREEVSFIILYRKIKDGPLHLRMSVKNKEIDAIAINLSEGGMAILTNYDLPAKTLASIKFILFYDKEPANIGKTKEIKVNCEVCYSFMTPENAYRIGLRFTDLTKGNRRAIVDFIRQTKNAKFSKLSLK